MPGPKLCIGLTGGIGSGKSVAANIFNDLGTSIIDADIAARKVIEPGTAAFQTLVKHFGSEILNPPSSDSHRTDEQAALQTLNRQKLRLIIFSDPTELNWMNHFMHPLIRDWMDKEARQASSNYVLKVIPLLTESELKQQVDRVLLIDAPVETQIQRAMRRDNSSRKDIERIINSQSSRELRLAKSDDVIINNTSFYDLEIAVKKMHNIYLKLAAEQRNHHH